LRLLQDGPYCVEAIYNHLAVGEAASIQALAWIGTNVAQVRWADDEFGSDNWQRYIIEFVRIRANKTDFQ